MINLVKYSPEQFDYDLEKTIILTGKGITSLKSSEAGKDDNCYVACVNTSAILHQKVDFLFFNDIEPIYELSDLYDYDFENIDNFISPIQLHRNSKVSDVTFRNVKCFLESKTTANLYTHRLFTQSINSPSEVDDLFFGNLTSTLHVAINWLCHVGFRKFKIYGSDLSGEYAPVFIHKKSVGNKMPKQWFQQNMKITKRILKKFDCDYDFV